MGVSKIKATEKEVKRHFEIFKNRIKGERKKELESLHWVHDIRF